MEECSDDDLTCKCWSCVMNKGRMPASFYESVSPLPSIIDERDGYLQVFQRVEKFSSFTSVSARTHKPMALMCVCVSVCGVCVNE